MLFRVVIACVLALPLLTFVNRSGRTIKVYWLDYAGTRKHYRTLAKDESYVQQTFVSRAPS